MEKIKIPKRFQQNLDDRFNPKKAKDCRIDIECNFCNQYLQIENCVDCPFDIFKTAGERGCMALIKTLIGTNVLYIKIDKIFWEIKDDKQARKQLKELREKAQELIEFI